MSVLFLHRQILNVQYEEIIFNSIIDFHKSNVLCGWDAR